MYKLKQSPEDFRVIEITEIKLKESGNYIIYLLKKKNYTTIRAIEQIAKYLNTNVKDIGFAGIKDKNAVTEQYISIKNITREEISEIALKDIKLTYMGYTNTPISLGNLTGNEFIITIRNTKTKKIPIKQKTQMPNLFGEQRFSKNNVKIGKALLKQDFKSAYNLILETNPDYKKEMQEHIKKKPNDFVGTLKLMHIKLLNLYTKAFQSDLWNKTLKEYVKSSKTKIKLPLLGFGTEIKDKKIKTITERIMQKENITLRSFINRSIPEISLEGDERDAFTEIKDLMLLEKGKDFIKITFKLPKASYATVAVEFLLNCKGRNPHV